MKIIAHRGGTFGKENSLETMIAAARSGIYAVECDIRKTIDGVYVIYHDDNLSRLTGESAKVSEITLENMQKYMRKAGNEVLTFEQLKTAYKESTPILLHIKLLDYDMDFAKMIAESGLPIIAGVMSLDMLKCFSKYFPPERILAFLPKPEMAKDFYENGTGIIRLWEQWLDKVTPTDIKKDCPNAEVFIMMCNVGETGGPITLESMDGSVSSLEKCKAYLADGVLLNNTEMALEWLKNKNK